MHKIQETSSLAKLTVDFALDRKKQIGTSSSLSPYTITITGGSSPGTYPASGFSNGYFVPVYNASKTISSSPAIDTTITKFIPIILGSTSEIYPIQCQWDFGDQILNTHPSLNGKLITTSVGSLNQGISSSSAPTTIAFASGTISNWPTTGAIMIDEEIFSYTGISNNSITGVMVGQYGTTKSNHTTSAKAYIASGYAPIEYYKYILSGPDNTNSNYQVTFTVIDNFYRKYVASKTVYPKLDA